MFLFFKKKTLKKHSIYFYFAKTWLKKINDTKLRNIFVGHKTKTKVILNSKYKQIWCVSKSPVNSVKSRENFSTVSNLFCKASTFVMFIKSKLKMCKSLQFLVVARLMSKVYQLINIKSFKLIYRSSYGNYLLLKNISFKRKKLIFVLPSRKKLLTSFWTLGLLGRNQLKLRKKYIARKLVKNLRLKYRSVRGVAMNPIDHHNGGKSNRKPLFLNKYNKLAKCNK